jgi:hypothetical protein
MALSLKLIEVSGATRCNKWVSNEDNKLSYSPFVLEWLTDSVFHAKNIKKSLLIKNTRRNNNVQ